MIPLVVILRDPLNGTLLFLIIGSFGPLGLGLGQPRPGRCFAPWQHLGPPARAQHEAFEFPDPREDPKSRSLNGGFL